MVESDEKNLVNRAKRDPEAFACLYDQYVDRIFAYAYRRLGELQEAQDVTSATFENALENIHRYQWKGISFGAWLYKIARNEVNAVFRRRRFREILLPWETGVVRAETRTDLNEDLQRLYSGFRKLSRKEQEIISLRFFDELSSSEVAEFLGCSVESVYLRLHRALTHLRRHVGAIEKVEGVSTYVTE